jgi:2-methylcitrate dehydratase PrpD
MDYLDTLSQFSSNLDYRTLDADVKDQVGWILADTVAAMTAGSLAMRVRTTFLS